MLSQTLSPCQHTTALHLKSMLLSVLPLPLCSCQGTSEKSCGPLMALRTCKPSGLTMLRQFLPQILGRFPEAPDGDNNAADRPAHWLCREPRETAATRGSSIVRKCIPREMVAHAETTQQGTDTISRCAASPDRPRANDLRILRLQGRIMPESPPILFEIQPRPCGCPPLQHGPPTFVAFGAASQQAFPTGT